MFVTKVIVPNVEFRSADEEQFEDNPEEFIRRDLEGSGENDMWNSETVPG